jgi:hypothetical protein
MDGRPTDTVLLRRRKAEWLRALTRRAKAKFARAFEKEYGVQHRADRGEPGRERTCAGEAGQDARFASRVVRPRPAQATQTMRLPRSRIWPVPQQRTQVRSTTAGMRLLCAEKRFPKVIFEIPYLSRQ